MSEQSASYGLLPAGKSYPEQVDEEDCYEEGQEPETNSERNRSVSPGHDQHQGGKTDAKEEVGESPPELCGNDSRGEVEDDREGANSNENRSYRPSPGPVGSAPRRRVGVHDDSIATTLKEPAWRDVGTPPYRMVRLCILRGREFRLGERSIQPIPEVGTAVLTTVRGLLGRREVLTGNW